MRLWIWSKALPASDKSVSYGHYLLVIGWLLLTFVAAAYFIAQRLVEFDPQRTLATLSQEDMQRHFSTLIPINEREANTGKVIHFSSANCRCNRISAAHKSSINLSARQGGLHVIDVELAATSSELPVPSVPAIALFDDKGELAYFGPYSQGIGCGESRSVVEVVLNNIRHGFNPELIVDQAKGCYCNV